MNLLHMKYAVAVAETQSINKAAEHLYVGQSALSRAIKELEGSLGVTLFERSAKGMTLTPEGEMFIRYARSVLSQVDAMEEMFREGAVSRKRFSISVPRASYIAAAFAAFSRTIPDGERAELVYRETNAMRALKNILQDECKLAILRYAENYDRYYQDMIEDKGLASESVAEFRYVLAMSGKSPLAGLPRITYDDLRGGVEVAHADPYVPTLPFAEVKKEELPDNTDRRIFVFERASQFELLAENPETFMWVSPIPGDLLDRYGLVQRVCNENRRVYRDVLIHRKDYSLSDLDNAFITELIRTKRAVLD